jgi:hypothetical protein
MLTTPMSLLQKAIQNYLIANRYFFQVNIANFHSNYITLRKLYSSKFADTNY